MKIKFIVDWNYPTWLVNEQTKHKNQRNTLKVKSLVVDKNTNKRKKVAKKKTIVQA